MTSTVGNLTALATWVAGLTFTGVTAKDLSGVPDAVNPQDCPLLVPASKYATDVAFTRLTWRDAAGGRSVELTYRVHYWLYYAPVLEGISYTANLAGALDAWRTVLNAVISNETPTGAAYDIRPAGDVNFGVVADPAGTRFWGCEVVFDVQEFG